MSDGYDYGDPYDRHPTPELPPGWLVAAIGLAVFVAFAGLAVLVGTLIWMFGAILRAVMP